jgi:hypothetical protein
MTYIAIKQLDMRSIAYYMSSCLPVKENKPHVQLKKFKKDFKMSDHKSQGLRDVKKAVFTLATGAFLVFGGNSLYAKQQPKSAKEEYKKEIKTDSVAKSKLDTLLSPCECDTTLISKSAEMTTYDDKGLIVLTYPNGTKCFIFDGIFNGQNVLGVLFLSKDGEVIYSGIGESINGTVYVNGKQVNVKQFFYQIKCR